MLSPRIQQVEVSGGLGSVFMDVLAEGCLVETLRAQGNSGLHMDIRQFQSPQQAGNFSFSNVCKVKDI